MLAQDYIELRCKSAFSFLDGASEPEGLVTRAHALGYHGLALADRDGLYGAPRFYKAAGLLGAPLPEGPLRRDQEVLDRWVETLPVRPILGAELSLADGAQLLVLVENRDGYRNLCRLLTTARSSLPRPRRGKVVPAITDELLGEHARGLVALGGAGEGAIGRALDHGNEAEARRALDRLVQIFGRRNTYLEVQRHLDPDEELRNRRMAALGSHAGLPIVATNDVRYAHEDDHRLHDVLTCVRYKTTVDAIGRRLAKSGERYLKSPRAMAELFRDLPAAVRATRAVAERCRFTLANLGYEFPDAETPAGESMQEHLERLTSEGAARRFLGGDYTDEVRRQIARELTVIGKLELAGYFLIVRDIIEYCRGRGILVQGRGSAANSAVCFALGITAVDAVKFKLLFERFLSEERGEWPDIDLDLPSGDAREEVIQYVYRKYGASRVAMTANVISYRPKMAVRDVGRALGFSEAELARMSKLLSFSGGGPPESPDEHIARSAMHGWAYEGPRDGLAIRLAEGGFSVEDERTRLLVELATKLLALPRHLGQHSGGMVIARGRLDEVVPLEPASMPGRVVVQWDKDDCADLGLIKIDLLGLGMMAVLADTMALVKAHEGKVVDIAQLPEDDKEVYAMLTRADTIGVFQVESRAQMATLPRMKPVKFYDLVIEVAIIRPGPIVGDMLHPFLRRRAGREEPDPLHSSLKEVLDRTLGVPLFQEQLMRMAMLAAGFTGGEAEELRRAMGFKRSEERMVSIEKKLRAGMTKQGITGATADRIVQSITAFALYGFPESHAASFALLVYASAFLKQYHPAAFLTALLNNWPMGFYHPSTLVRDALHHEVEVRPIDVRHSSWLCTMEKGGEAAGQEDERRPPAVRIGLRYLSGWGEEAALRLVRARGAAPFSSVEDLAHRAGLGREMLARLAEGGALATLGGTRRAALWQVEAVGRSGPLFASASSVAEGRGASPLAEMTEREELAADYRIAGLSTGRHPMELRRTALDRMGVVPANELPALAKHHNGRRVRIAGHVIVRQRPGTAKGFFFLTLEDETGLSNAIVTPQSFEGHRPLLVSASALLLEGVLQHLDGSVSVKADRFQLLDEVTAPSHDFH